MPCTDLEIVIEKFTGLTQKPVKFLTVQKDVKDDLKNLVKSLYDFTKKQEKGKKNKESSSLPELIVKDFDEEQIWQQIELQNNACYDPLVWEVANFIAAKNDLKFPISEEKDEEELPSDEDQESIQENEESIEENEDSNEEIDNSEEDMDNEGEENDEDGEPRVDREEKRQRKLKPSIVDDKFFKLQEMEQFLLDEEKKDGKSKPSKDSDDESIDFFEDVESADDDDEDGGNDAMYSDFFEGQQQDNYFDDDQNDNDNDEDNEMEEMENVKPQKKKDKKVSFAGLPSDDDESQDKDEDDVQSDDSKLDAETQRDLPLIQGKEEQKSEFELRQQRLKQQISKLEERTMLDSPWQLKGEVDASKRPQNSLLQEVVDFDQTSRPPPIITEQTTVTLEQIITQRVKDKAWDDVVRKEKPTDDALAFRKTEILDHAKSKLSLAQVYEAEYLKQKQASSKDDVEEKEPEAQTKIREAMSSLFAKLDALSNNHYTPKAAQPEVKIVSNTPAINMEEVAPVAASNAALLAPEEVKNKRSGDLMSKEERSKTDKKRERRKKKKLQKSKGTVAKVTEQRNTTKSVEGGNDKALKTSKAFFQQLNDESNSLIKKNKRKNDKNKGQ